jgi:hypothetical protein
VASQLTRLVLSSPLVEHVSFIRACKQLQVLNLSGCMQLESLAPLSACTKLLELILDGCQSVKDLAPISTCVNLRVLSLRRWEDEEGRGLSLGFTTAVAADGCPIDTLEHLLDLLLPLTQLDTLMIDCDGFESLEALEGSALSQLQRLSLEVTEWRGEKEPLALGVLSSCCPGLKELRLTGFEDDDLSWLPSCTSLEELDIKASAIDSFEAVRSCSPALQCIVTVEWGISVDDEVFDPLWELGFRPFQIEDESRRAGVLWWDRTMEAREDDEDEDGSSSSNSDSDSEDDFVDEDGHRYSQGIGSV